MALGGVLLDLEGVLYQDGRPIDGALDAAIFLKDAGVTRMHLAAPRSLAEDLALDLGPFVAALEYAAGIEADVMGKPSPDPFGASNLASSKAGGPRNMAGLLEMA